METIKGSVARTTGLKGTYQSEYGGIGLGYLVDGIAYKDGGNGHYYEVKVKWFYADGGEGYLAAVATLALPPAYTR